MFFGIMVLQFLFRLSAEGTLGTLNQGFAGVGLFLVLELEQTLLVMLDENGFSLKVLRL